MSIEEKDSYLRIGTNYYKIIDQPLASKDTVRKIILWSGGLISEDFGAPFKKTIPKFDSFCNIPDNINYERKVGNSYNMYEPIEWDITNSGKFDLIETFLNHIFDEQYNLGLDYITIIWRYPTQILPILCLVSTERETGKTTFLNFLKEIFGFNMTINTNEDFRNQFNSGWASKLIIGVEEVYLPTIQDTEHIKNLSTSKSVKSESKGKDKIEQQFYGKFILCTNNEFDFMKISPEETRFWVRKIPKIEKLNKDMIDLMKKEIPFFLHFLTNRDIVTENTTRMWFTSEQLYTDALRKVINGGASKLEKEIKSLIADQILLSQLESIKLIPKDIIELLKIENNVSIQLSDVLSIICDKWNYRPVAEPGHYKRYKFYFNNNGEYEKTQENRTGRYYTFKKENFCAL